MQFPWELRALARSEVRIDWNNLKWGSAYIPRKTSRLSTLKDHVVKTSARPSVLLLCCKKSEPMTLNSRSLGFASLMLTA